MKRCALVLAGAALVSLACGVAWAADGTTPPAVTPPAAEQSPAAKPHEGQLAERLGLTPEQREQFRAILKAAHEEAQKATDPAAKRQIYEQAMEKIKTTVLTPDQQKKLSELRENPGERAHEMLGRWAEKLGLTADQEAQAKAILKAAHDEAEKATDRAAKMKIFRDAMEKIKTTVLTDDQRKKLAELREGGKMHPGAETPKTPKT